MTDRPLVQIANVPVAGQFENADVALHQSAVSALSPLGSSAKNGEDWPQAAILSCEKGMVVAEDYPAQQDSFFTSMSNV